MLQSREGQLLGTGLRIQNKLTMNHHPRIRRIKLQWQLQRYLWVSWIARTAVKESGLQRQNSWGQNPSGSFLVCLSSSSLPPPFDCLNLLPARWPLCSRLKIPNEKPTVRVLQRSQNCNESDSTTQWTTTPWSTVKPHSASASWVGW